MVRPASLQDLAPKWARLCLDVDARLQTLVPDISGSSLVLSCSGGIDSIALLHILSYLAPKNKFTLHIVHLDHGLRFDSSKDYDFVDALCQERGLTFHGSSVNIQNIANNLSIGLEEAGRHTRYDLFESVRKTTQSAHILLGHHQGDLMEDVLMRLIRGAGWPSIGGMVELDPDRHLLRPLLEIEKNQLRSFLVENDFSWREDTTNSNLDFTRNRMRHVLLPQILKENSGFGKAINRLHTQANLDRDYFEQIISEITAAHSNEKVTIQICNIISLHAAIRIRLYKKMLDSLGAGQVLASTLLELDKAVENAPLPKNVIFQFPAKKTVTIAGKELIFAVQISDK